LLTECFKNDLNRLFKQRFKNNELCLIAISNDGHAAGFGWITKYSQHRDDASKCLFSFPEGALYTYNWYIDPKYRLTGLRIGFMKHIIDSNHYNPSKGIIVFIAHNNIPSFKTHIRYGFKLFQRKVILTSFNMAVFFDKSLEHTDANIQKLVANNPSSL
jgi:hypothetical protein